MFPTSLLFVLVLGVSASSAVTARNGLTTLPLTKKVNVTSAQHIVQGDRLRAARLRAVAEAKANGQPLPKADATAASVGLTNQAVTYTANVEVGSPATTFTLLLDTGSSNTWVGAGKPFAISKTTGFTSNIMEIEFGSGAVLGVEFTDTVTIGTGLTIPSQSIGAAVESSGFDGVDGILGIGPVDLTEGTLIPDSGSAVPTVTDNLFSQGSIPSHLVSVSFEPTTKDPNPNGELTFGGTDSSKFTGNITFVPITTTQPASEFWGIDQSVAFGNQTILASTAGIVDTGTTLTLLASDAFAAYQTATGAVLDDNTGLLKVTQKQFNSLQSLFFNIGGTTFELTPNAQLWPRALNTDIGGTANGIYLIVSDLGTPSGEGFDFVNGMTFLERHFSVFDTAGSRVGLATTPFTNATTN